MSSMPYESSDYVYDPNRMIKYLTDLNNEVTTVVARLETIESQMQVLLKGHQCIIGGINKILRSTKKDTPSKSARNKRKLQRLSKETNATDVSKLLHLQKALQKNISKFTEHMIVRPILDSLFEADCLSYNECEAIRSMPNTQDGARMVLRKIMPRGPNTIYKFLEIIEKQQSDLRELVDTTLNKLVEEHRNKPICVICVMRTTVDLKDIGDLLLEEGMISSDLHGDIYDGDIYSHKQIHWDHIISAIHDYEDPNAAFDVLKNALKDRYDHIVQYLDQAPEKAPLSCCCCQPRRRIRKRTGSTGSQTDLSTTSSYRVPRLPTVLNDPNDASSSDVYSSMDLPSETLSFEPLELYEDIETKEVQDQTVTSSTYQNTDGQSHYTSGNFEPSSQYEEKGFKDIQDPIITSSNDQNTNERGRHTSGKFVPSAKYEENREDIVLSLPIAGSQKLERASPLIPSQGINAVQRSISVQSTDTIRANTSNSSDDASSSTFTRHYNTQSSTDMSLTPSPKTHMPSPLATLSVPSVDPGEETDNEMDQENIHSHHLKGKSRKVLHKRIQYLRPSKSEVGYRHRSSLKARNNTSESSSLSKPRSVPYIYRDIRLRRESLRRKKRRTVQQRYGSQNAIATARNDRNPCAKLLSQPHRRNWLSRDIVARWNKLKAKYHDRIAQLDSDHTQVDDD